VGAEYCIRAAQKPWWNSSRKTSKRSCNWPPSTPGDYRPWVRSERDVLDLLAAGARNHEIASCLGLSEKTVRYDESWLRLGDRPLVPAVAPSARVMMDEHFVWVTTRRIKPDTLLDFERAWRPEHHPTGMRRAYAYWSEDGQEVIGVSFWESKESCEAWRRSQDEARRRGSMAPYVLEEREAFYRGRELRVPTQ
jgi:heme-degrading monooxygenase HmoA